MEVDQIRGAVQRQQTSSGAHPEIRRRRDRKREVLLGIRDFIEDVAIPSQVRESRLGIHGDRTKTPLGRRHWIVDGQWNLLRCRRLPYCHKQQDQSESAYHVWKGPILV